MKKEGMTKVLLVLAIFIIVLLSFAIYRTLNNDDNNLKSTTCISLRDKAMGEAIPIKSLGGYLESLEQEKKHLESLYGIQDVNWENSAIMRIDSNGRYYDEVIIKLIPSGEIKSIYFDVTEPFGDLVDMIRQGGRLES